MACAEPCFNHEHRQGRGCECDTNASRAALGMRTLGPLHQAEGGHVVRGPLSFPIEREEDDRPVITPETAAESIPSLAKALCLLALFGLLALYAVRLIAGV